MNTITWLHISDLHFRTSQAYDANVVLRALLRDVAERIEQEGLQPDFLAVSGDIAFSGQPAEYDLARRFFDDLLRTTELPKERLFLVPGNHDVNRSLVSRGRRWRLDELWLSANATPSWECFASVGQWLRASTPPAPRPRSAQPPLRFE